MIIWPISSNVRRQQVRLAPTQPVPPHPQAAADDDPRPAGGWHTIPTQGLVGGVREQLVLVTLVMVVPTLVVNKGGDALSACTNAVAMLFMCEIDNIAYAVGLSESARARVEAVGRVELGEKERGALARLKSSHTVLVVAAVMAGVLTRTAMGAAQIPITVLSFLVGGVLEAATTATTGDGGDGKAAAVAVATTVASSFAGVLGFGLRWVLAYRGE